MLTNITKAALLTLTLAFMIPAATYAQGNCETAEAEAFLDVNNVRARIFNNGALFWRGDPLFYEVPKNGGANSIFTANIWVGGQVGGELRMAAARYSRFQFWPGPLTEVGTLPDPDDCSAFDRIYKVSQRDLIEYEATGVAPQDLSEWPWRLGAPVIDGDGNPANYNLEGGDRPELLGHQTLWWVMNDLGNEHEFPAGDKTPPIGLEVQVTAFAAQSERPAINDATFYRYKLIYRGVEPLEEAFVGFFVDPDLGNFDDDYIGSDTTLNLGFVYNSDNVDEGSGGYGEKPPALGISLMQGPRVDGEPLGMTSFMFFNSGGCVTCDPITAADNYNYMQARWRDGRPVTLGGFGREFSEEPTTFMFAGDPVTGAFWSERNADGDGTTLPPADRRFVMASGPFTMQPGEEQDVVFAITWARGDDHLASVTALKQATAEVQATFADGFNLTPPPAPAQATQLTAPADNALGQPTNPTLHWEPVGGAAEYQVDLATDEAFVEGLRSYIADAPSVRLEELDGNARYYWRVRGANAGGFGPWSEVWRFSTSDVTLFDGGLLTLEDGSPAFVEVVGPGGIDPCGPEAGSTGGCAEVGGNDVWESFNSTGAYILGAPSPGPEQRIGAFTPNDYELRVTEGGSLGQHIFTSGSALWIPIELWDIGPTGPFNENDPADDVRLIPAMFADSQNPDNECMFGYDEGELFGRPFSDRLYGYYPAPGMTYDDYEAILRPLVDADPNGCPQNQATSDAINIINASRGRPLQRIVFIDNSNGATDIADLEGTVIRFYTAEFAMSPPVPGAPLNLSVSLPTTVPMWWSASPGAARFQLQVSLNRDFTARVVDDSTLARPTYTLENIPVEGSHYWRVRAFNASGGASAWSETWAFTVGTATAVVDAEAGIPETFELEPNYPNPFNPSTTIRFGVPQAGPVTVTVYNLLGQRVATLVQGQYSPGWYTVPWEARGVGSGVYFYHIEAGTFRATRSMLLLK